MSLIILSKPFVSPSICSLSYAYNSMIKSNAVSERIQNTNPAKPSDAIVNFVHRQDDRGSNHPDH